MNWLFVLKVTLEVIVVILSVMLTALILMHKGKGGGLSDMFGGGISSSAGSSGVAERNLNRITLAILLIWVVSIIGMGVLMKFAA